jgi:ABC-type branched-subunit amino acid transport system substrate-binding protein
VGLYPVYAAASTEVLLDAIARSDGTRDSVARELLKTRLANSVIGPVSFDKYGDVRPAPVSILRVARKQVSAVPYQTHGALFAVIEPPAAMLR